MSWPTALVDVAVLATLVEILWIERRKP